MKYREFEITLNFIDTICSKDREGNREFRCGYLCRIYSVKDIMHEKLIDEFYITDYRSRTDHYGEVEKAIEYIDNNYDSLIVKLNNGGC